MLRTAFVAVLSFLTSISFAQDSSTVQWQVSSKKLATGEYELQLTGKVQAGKYLYLYTQDAEGLDSISKKTES